MKIYYHNNDIKYLNHFLFDLIIGEMTVAYGQFRNAARTCLIYDEFSIFRQKTDLITQRVLKKAALFQEQPFIYILTDL
ncbi:hypothetical protein [uncultured Bacteroides sp.]|uniref:hypothetical protein n=1 Tax=uncultured Bacteroides sp. TaxID=162156 RepID=UPI0025CED38D|nr:hypothetical protein [uncultured Bacteroides sp.]